MPMEVYTIQSSRIPYNAPPKLTRLVKSIYSGLAASIIALIPLNIGVFQV